MTIGTQYSTSTAMSVGRLKALKYNVTLAQSRGANVDQITGYLDSQGVRPDQRGLFGIAPPSPDAKPGAAGQYANAVNRGLVGGIEGLSRLAGGAVVGGNPAMMASGYGLDQGIPGVTPFLASSREAYPAPTGMGGRMLEAGAAGLSGGLATGGAGGMVPGVMSALGSQGAAELGLPPWAQFGAGMVAGAAPTLARMIPTQAIKNAQTMTGPMAQRGINPQRALEGMAQQAEANPTTPGLQLMGREGEELAQRVAASGGPAGERVTALAQQIDRSVSQRFVDRMRGLFGKGSAIPSAPRGGRDLLMELDDEMRTQVGPKYAAVKSVDVQTTPELAALLDDPTIAKAYKDAQRGLQTAPESFDPQTGSFGLRSVPGLYVTNAKGQVVKDAMGRPQLQDKYPLLVLDEMKKNVDEIAGQAIGQTTDEATAKAILAARSAKERLQPILWHIDQQFKGKADTYAAARQAAQSVIQRRQAVKLGQDLGQLSDDEIRAFVQGDPGKGLPPASSQQVAYFKAGAIDKLMRTAQTGNPESALGTFEEGIRRLEPLLGPEDTKRVQQFVQETGDLRARLNRVQSAATPRARAQTAGRLKRAMVEVGLFLFRSASRDIITEMTTGVELGPARAAFAADALGAKGADLAAMLRQMAGAEPQRAMRVLQGAAGTAGGATGSVLAPRQTGP